MKIVYNGYTLDPVDYKPRFFCTIWVGEDFGFRVLIKDEKIYDFRRFGADNGLFYETTNYNIDQVFLNELFLRLKDNPELLLTVIKNTADVHTEIEKTIKSMK